MIENLESNGFRLEIEKAPSLMIYASIGSINFTANFSAFQHKCFDGERKNLQRGI
jgi:hypothetical protein